MKMGMYITYEVGDGLYVNLTNRCSNNCTFCIRANGDGAYGSEPLWLEREPTVSEIIASILDRDIFKYRELVFCGYGEPSYRLKEIREVVVKVKEIRPDLYVRINTNGQSDLILGEDSAHLYQGIFDEVSISLNAPNAEKYTSICKPIFGSIAFDSLLEFAKNVKNYVQNVVFSVVKETLSEEELSKCIEITKACGCKIKIRDYISG